MNATIRERVGGLHLLDRPAEVPWLYLLGVNHEIQLSYRAAYQQHPAERVTDNAKIEALSGETECDLQAKRPS